MQARLRTVGLSWTYEIFIDPASLWVGCLVGCPLLIRVSGNKHTTGQTSVHTLGMWALEILHPGRESSRREEDPREYSIFDLDSVCTRGLEG